MTDLVESPVTAISVVPVGTGQMADTVRVALTYAEGATGPASVVAKFASTDEHSRSAAAMVRAYEIEVSIYNDLPTLPGVPRSLYAAYDAEANAFTLILEDMSPCTQGDDIAGTDPATAARCLERLAALHAAGWEDPSFAAHEWLNRHDPEQRETTAELVAMLAPLFLERFGSRVADEHRALVDRLLPILATVVGGYDGPHTLTHGDYRLDNMLFRDGESAPTIVDWQTAVWANPAHDVAYFIGGSLSTNDRRTYTDGLLDGYHAALVAAGVDGYSREQLAEDVRRASVGGVVMAFASAILVVQTERGDAMFAEMFRRHAQHALDADALALLDRPAPDTAHAVAVADEDRHEPGDDHLWNESWYADVVSADGSIAAYVRLGLYPNLDQAWWHAVVVGAGRPLVLSARTDLALPGSDLVLHGDGIDVVLVVDEGLRSFTVRGTMTAARHADPSDVYESASGEPVPLALDLTWRTDGVPYHYGMTTRYEIPCAVEGSVTLDGEILRLDGPGQRDHSWGVRDWWSFGWCWCAGHLDDGTHLHLADIRLEGARFAAGYVQTGGDVLPVTSGSVTEQLGDHGFPTTAKAVLGDLTVEITPTSFGPIRLEGPDGQVGRFPRAAATFKTADGRTGSGWVEWNQP
jgi:aminoglycoside phosphotransferase (APT) family kinase protein